MKIVRNPWLPPHGFDAINILGILFCRRSAVINDELVRHERIHTCQMREMLFVGFYLWYVVEWLVRLPMRGNAYRNISFEREAYSHDADPGYLLHRHPYAWLHYLRHSR